MFFPTCALKKGEKPRPFVSAPFCAFAIVTRTNGPSGHPRQRKFGVLHLRSQPQPGVRPCKTPPLRLFCHLHDPPARLQIMDSHSVVRAPLPRPEPVLSYRPGDEMPPFSCSKRRQRHCKKTPHADQHHASRPANRSPRFSPKEASPRARIRTAIAVPATRRTIADLRVLKWHPARDGSP